MAEHNDLGRLGEDEAVKYLILHGYAIVARNWRFGHAEIDIVAERWGTLVFVEVKTRSSDTFAAPEDAVDREKMRLLLRAGNAYMHYNKLECDCRFDILSLVGTQPPFAIHHIRNAFDAQAWRGETEYKPTAAHTELINLWKENA